MTAILLMVMAVAAPELKRLLILDMIIEILTDTVGEGMDLELMMNNVMIITLSAMMDEVVPEL